MWFQIKDVYLAAFQLRIERVVNECAAHLVSDLSSETSIETRSLPGINRNKNFVSKVDQFISEHVSKQFKRSFNPRIGNSKKNFTLKIFW